jgi:homoserine acetyltransferase
MIISVEMSDDDWGFVCGTLDVAGAEAEFFAQQAISADPEDADGDAEEQEEAALQSKRIAAYITTVIANAFERARPKFSEN